MKVLAKLAQIDTAMNPNISIKDDYKTTVTVILFNTVTYVWQLDALD